MESRTFLLFGLLAQCCWYTTCSLTSKESLDDGYGSATNSLEPINDVLDNFRGLPYSDFDLEGTVGGGHTTDYQKYPQDKRFSGFVGSRGRRNKVDSNDLYVANKRFSPMGFSSTRAKRLTADYQEDSQIKRFSGFIGSRGRRNYRIGNMGDEMGKGNRGLNSGVLGIMSYLRKLHNNNKAISDGQTVKRHVFHAVRGKRSLH